MSESVSSREKQGAVDLPEAAVAPTESVSPAPAEDKPVEEASVTQTETRPSAATGEKTPPVESAEARPVAEHSTDGPATEKPRRRFSATASSSFTPMPSESAEEALPVAPAVSAPQTAVVVPFPGAKGQASDPDRLTNEEVASRIATFSDLILQGRLPYHAILHDRPEELLDKSPEEIRALYDDMMNLSGLGAKEPVNNPLGLHPYLFARLRMVQDVGKAWEGIVALRDRAAVAKLAAEPKPSPATKRGIPPVASAMAPASPGSRQPSVMRGGANRPPVSPSVTGGNGRDADQELVEASWRYAADDSSANRGSRHERANQRQVIAGPGAGAVATVPVGLLSGLWYAGGRMFADLGDRIASRRQVSVPVAAPETAPAPEAVPTGESAPTPAAADVVPVAPLSGVDIDAIERDCRKLRAQAALLRDYAAMEPMAKALAMFEQVAKDKGRSHAEMWRAVHEAARVEPGVGAPDQDARRVADAISAAMDATGAGDVWNDMRTTADELRGKSSTLLETLGAMPDDRKDEAKPVLERLDKAMESVADLKTPFEKPGDEEALERLKEMAKRISETIKAFIARVFGTEASGPAPSP